MSSYVPEQAGAEGQPLVTIVVPTYNRAGLVEETIDSILEQDYRNLEALVLDDGSTDGTEAVLERYAARHPERFRWSRHDNMGQARTLNRGFEMARGDLIGYLNSDDLFLPGAISKMVAAFAADPEAVLVYPAYRRIGPDGRVLSTMVPPEYTAADALRLHSCIVNVGAIFRRSVSERIGGWDPSFIYLADFDWCIRASRLGPFRRVAEPLACWRDHPGSANDAPGFLGAAEQTRLLDKIYAADDVGEDLLAVRAEAYRNAYFCAAYAMGDVNHAGERFYVHDTLAREVTVEAPDEDAQLIARLRKRVAELEKRDRWLVEALDRAAVSAPSRGGASARLVQPRWFRSLRRLVPARLRPHGRRMLERAFGRRLPPPQAILGRSETRPERSRASAGSAARRR